MSSKEFLLQECENVKDVLEETLRFKYGLDGSEEFYHECETRRQIIQSEIRATDENNLQRLASNGRLLSELSGLVSRIERSSLGEYSWPFVEELKEIAFSICKEDTASGKDTPPKVYVLSGGGLSSYRIYPERQRSFVSKKRILTIVFPRTLKHYVLFHPILGHEIGHAMWRCSKHQHELRKIVSEELINTGGRFASADETADWIYSQNPPTEMEVILKSLEQRGFKQDNIFARYANWDAWKEEILCDLVGLVIFGPSFVAAHAELLYAISPSGITLGQLHPPPGCRVNMIIRAAKIMKYDDISTMDDCECRRATEKYWEEYEAKIKPDPWFDIFSDDQLRKAIERISALVEKYPPTLFEFTSGELLKSPPVSG